MNISFQNSLPASYFNGFGQIKVSNNDIKATMLFKTYHTTDYNTLTFEVMNVRTKIPNK